MSDIDVTGLDSTRTEDDIEEVTPSTSTMEESTPQIDTEVKEPPIRAAPAVTQVKDTQAKTLNQTLDLGVLGKFMIAELPTTPL